MNFMQRNDIFLYFIYFSARQSACPLGKWFAVRHSNSVVVSIVYNFLFAVNVCVGCRIVCSGQHHEVMHTPGLEPVIF